jgi:hypothetical protein
MTQLSYGHFGFGWMFQPRTTSACGGDGERVGLGKVKTFEATCLHACMHACASAGGLGAMHAATHLLHEGGHWVEAGGCEGRTAPLTRESYPAFMTDAH